MQFSFEQNGVVYVIDESHQSYDDLRPVRVGDGLAHISLSNGYVTVIDEADLPLVDGVNWSAQVQNSGSRKRVFAVRNVKDKASYRLQPMHRLIAGATDEQTVRHINGDTLDNRRANLSLAQKSVLPPGKYRGVTYEKSSGMWKARLVDDGKTLFLGRYATAYEARDVYVDAARRRGLL